MKDIDVLRVRLNEYLKKHTVLKYSIGVKISCFSKYSCNKSTICFCKVSMIVIEFVDGQSTRKIGRDGFITQELLKNTHKSNAEVVEGNL